MGQIIRIGDTAYDFGDKDWTYLQGKQPDSNHELQAEIISKLAGVEITPQQCMAFLAMHRFIQKSQANQDRANFRGRTWESVLRGNATLAEKASERHGPVVHRPIGVPVEDVPAEPVQDAPKPGARQRRQPSKASKAAVSQTKVEEGSVEAPAAV